MYRFRQGPKAELEIFVAKNKHFVYALDVMIAIIKVIISTTMIIATATTSITTAKPPIVTDVANKMMIANTGIQ